MPISNALLDAIQVMLDIDAIGEEKLKPRPIAPINPLETTDYNQSKTLLSQNLKDCNREIFSDILVAECLLQMGQLKRKLDKDENDDHQIYHLQEHENKRKSHKKEPGSDDAVKDRHYNWRPRRNIRRKLAF